MIEKLRLKVKFKISRSPTKFECLWQIDENSLRVQIVSQRASAE